MPGQDDRIDQQPGWMRQFMGAPADLTKNSRANEQYAPPSRDARLRRAQEEALLDDQIWLLAQSEAYGAGNEGWFQNALSQTKAQIVAGYLKDHPPIARFVADHMAAGTCADAVRVLEEERRHRKTGPGGVTQETVNAWMLEYYQTAQKKGRPPPKRWPDAFNDCKKAVTSTDAQMREAMKQVPTDLKRPRGRLQQPYKSGE